MGLKELIGHAANVREAKRQEEEAEALRRERQLQEAARRAEEEARRAAELAWARARPHLLLGNPDEIIEKYVLLQLLLRKSGHADDKDGEVLKAFALSLRLDEERIKELQRRMERMDDSEQMALLQEMHEIFGDEPVALAVLLCDFTRLHGKSFLFQGEFREFWQDLCDGIFHLNGAKQARLERLCSCVARRLGRGGCDDFPRELLDYYLPENDERLGSYLVLDLNHGLATGEYPLRFTNEPPELSDEEATLGELWLRRLPAGVFAMGSPANELGRRDNEALHEVTLPRPFFIGVTPVTQRQWEAVMGFNPSHNINSHWPVENVSYDDICGATRPWPVGNDVMTDSFMGRLRIRTGLDFDLPTEAQWEYACRAGTDSALSSGEEIQAVTSHCERLDRLGWYAGNSSCVSHEVARKMPNGWGLFDMHGNVQEWCRDWLGEVHQSPTVEPVGPETGTQRVCRGGGFSSFPAHCRSACRAGYAPEYFNSNLGFRVALLVD